MPISVKVPKLILWIEFKLTIMFFFRNLFSVFIQNFLFVVFQIFRLYYEEFYSRSIINISNFEISKRVLCINETDFLFLLRNKL